MLPSPAVNGYTYRRGTRFQSIPSTRKRVVETLTRRSRITNLGVLLLAGALVFSVLLNLGRWTSSQNHSDHHHRTQLTDVERPGSLEALKNLIIVPCHSIWVGSDSWHEEKDWMLESYQKGPGRVRAFYEHIFKSVELNRNDPHSLLVFSGGQTKSMSWITEAESYLKLAHTAELFSGLHKPPTPFNRATTENFALDSFQNLLFSIARFREYTGHFPSKITVIGYGFKRARFVDLHREALRWPSERFEYIGIDPEPDAEHNPIDGEVQNGYIPYAKDKYGCHSVLHGKRRERNPHFRFHPYEISAPELKSLLEWCPGWRDGGETATFTGKLPWISS